MVPSNAIGIQAEYRDDYKIVTYCDFEFSSFPFESLSCKVTYRLSVLTVGYITLSKPSIYFNFNNDEMTRIKIGTNLPYDIYAEATDPFILDDHGYLFPATGVTFHLTRNNLGSLLSGYYAPMASFAILAILSFNIHIDAVSLTKLKKLQLDFNCHLIDFKKVPGRMGMVITLCLISFNVYIAIDAPPKRGFSYIEVWMLGMEIPIIFALLEYSMILGLKRCSHKKFKFLGNIEKTAAQIDSISSLTSISYILIFSMCYWSFM